MSQIFKKSETVNQAVIAKKNCELSFHKREEICFQMKH